MFDFKQGNQPRVAVYDDTKTKTYDTVAEKVEQRLRDTQQGRPQRSQHCGVRESLIQGADQGLFANRDFSKGEVVTLYAGTKISVLYRLYSRFLALSSLFNPVSGAFCESTLLISLCMTQEQLEWVAAQRYR